MRTYSPKASEITRKWFVIDAQDLVLAAFDDGNGKAITDAEFDGIGQIEFALGIGIADAPQQIRDFRHPERHHTRVAEADTSLGIGGISLLPDCDQPALMVSQQAPIT